MPGGVCATKDVPHGGYSRVAEVVVRTMGIQRTLYLGGAAEAYFPDRSDDDLRNLGPGDEFRLVWRDSVFFGRDALLGDVHARLARGSGAAETSGTVKSLAKTSVSDATAQDAEFFPALNVNQLHFEVLVRRFGLRMSSLEPIVNEATIKQIPPFGSVYRLKRPVQFSSSGGRHALLDAVTPRLEIQTCNIRLVLHGGMKTSVKLAADRGDEVEFEAEISNESAAEQVDATWMLWPRPPEQLGHPMGVVSLGRAPTKFNFSCARDIFYQPRWFVVSGTTPIENDAAAAVRMPGLA